jgi:hypothetical protein
MSLNQDPAKIGTNSNALPSCFKVPATSVFTSPKADTREDELSSISYKPSQEQFLIQEGKTGTKKTYSSLLSYLHNWWLWEIISIFVSLICMACIVVVLLSYHNRPIPSLPAGLTFNALVSLLATLSKAAMLVTVASCISQLKWHWFSSTRKMRDFELFDQASRGPWGSFGLIARTRSPWLVGLGAFITIMALGVEPFMQQIIFFTVEPMATPTTPTISRAQTYDASAYLSDCMNKAR